MESHWLAIFLENGFILSIGAALTAELVLGWSREVFSLGLNERVGPEYIGV